MDCRQCGADHARETPGRFVRVAVLAAVCVILHSTAQANDAEIVSLIGKGDARATADAEWAPAAVKQKLTGGSFVRTREQSQMALLLKDSTQVRLNQQSILNIKVVGGPQQATQLELPQGRAWSQAKPRGADVAAGKRPILEVSTPAATAAIRGTDWELVVEPDGTSTLTVLSGAVDFYNEHGRVAVAPNEQARAVKGKAPTKIFLSTAAERVQWVTSYRPEPRRWVPRPTGTIATVVKNIEAAEYGPALQALEKDKNLPRLEAALLLADMRLFLGEPAQAIAILDPHARDGNGEPMAAALLGRALIISGRLTDAARVLGSAGKTHTGHVEVLLAQAELGRVQGDAVAARSAAEKVIGIDPKNAEPWHVIGRIETEREYVRAAREALNRAITLRPDGPGYKGESGTLETFANEFSAAEAAFKGALDQTPDDYVALTGLGILQLKRGETEGALESFLKAGVIEPRYARAWFYSGVAYYQLGEHVRAHEAFEKASKLDDKDPLPYFMKSLAYFDSLELGKSIEAAREAQARLPFLKSLNQVLTDQKGSANLGSALAAFGMEEWSQSYAYDSYSPYWAGSPLFLADRFSGTFNRNTELFKGFLSDPSVFGASNRYSSMVPVPGHYGSVGATLERRDFTQAGASATLNGYSTAAVPFSYFVGFDKTHGDSRKNDRHEEGNLRSGGENLIFGLGLKPTHELSLFAFGNPRSYDGRVYGAPTGVTDARFDVDADRYDVGLSYKFRPNNHAWLKLGRGTEEQSGAGAIFSQPLADALNRLSGANFFVPGGQLERLRSGLTQRDVQWRHTFDVSAGIQLSWGIEHSEQDKHGDLSLRFNDVLAGAFQRFMVTRDDNLQSRQIYLSSRFKAAAALEAQADLFVQKTTTRTVGDPFILQGLFIVDDPDTFFEKTRTEVNPRVGLKWRPDPAHTLRLAGQEWRRPAGVNTLAPVDTVGIPIDDEIVAAGGRLLRARLQHEIQWDNATFFQWYLDTRRVDNQKDPIDQRLGDIQLVNLDRLRLRQQTFGLRSIYLEETPEFTAGRIDTLGIAVNRLLSRNYTISGRYVYASSKNTNPAFLGNELPYHPRHYLNLAFNWQPYRRVFVGPMATYRSARYRDEQNTEQLAAGWLFGLAGYWESEDKRLSLAASIDQIPSRSSASLYRRPTGQLQAIYRF